MKTIYYFTVSSSFAFLLNCSNPAAPSPIPNGIALLNKSNFSAMTNVPDRISMVEFFSPQSQHCLEMDSSVARISRKYKDTVLIGKVNYLEEPGLSGQYYIQVLPTFLFLAGGRESRQLIRNFADAPQVAEDSLIMIIDSLRTPKSR